MFQKAYSLAATYTQPLLIAMRHQSGRVDSGLGSFIYLNKDGWAMTAAHNFGPAFGFQQHEQERKAYEERKAMILGSSSLSHEEKDIQLSALGPGQDWLTHYTFLPGGQHTPILENYIYNEHDLAFFRVDPKAVNQQVQFPKLVEPGIISPGISLCKLGYPFVEFQSSFNDTNGQFVLPQNLLPLPMFPMEGMYTRNFLKGYDGENREILFLETSSPGLKGQSGGPIFDRNGILFAVQSQNLTIHLGFTGVVQKNGVGVEENQFLNLGIGVHPKTMHALLQKQGINYFKA
ncbi:MAG TPA: trypsin-like peptidase domain-containing protein [Chitinophagaceae bacterium]|nr:trypsin-like peptidase domain-containing protein [Chitinophagaceae bacterium]